MSQEETRDKISSGESSSELHEEGVNSTESINDLTKPEDSQDIEHLPIDSIGSYARLEESVTDEESKDSDNSTSQS